MGHFDWSNWLYGMFVAIIGGGANAALAAIVVNWQDPKDYNATTWAFLNLVVTLFVFGAIKDFLLYIKNQPLPKLIEKTTTTHTVEKSTTPAPTVEEEPREQRR